MLTNIFQKKLIQYCNNTSIIVQIGGCDGILDDPLYKYVCEYKPILHVAEPIKKYYDELVINYNEIKSVKTYNCAITDKNGTITINYIDCAKSKWNWLKGCSSMYTTKNVLSGYMGKSLNEKIDDELANYIKNNTHQHTAICYNLENFLSLANIQSYDVIVTDTEGNDFNIFKQINFNNCRPKIYYSEFYSFTSNEKIEMISKLNELNYICITDGYNILAYE